MYVRTCERETKGGKTEREGTNEGEEIVVVISAVAIRHSQSKELIPVCLVYVYVHIPSSDI